MFTRWRVHLTVLVTVAASSLAGCYAFSAYPVVPPQSLLEERLPADTYVPPYVPSPGTYGGADGRGGSSH